MSQRASYYSDQWVRPGSQRESPAPSRDACPPSGPPRSATVPNSDGHAFAPFASPPPPNEYRLAPQRTIDGRPSPDARMFGSAQFPFNQLQRADHPDVGMSPSAGGQLPYDPTDLPGNLNRGLTELPRTSTSFQIPYQVPQSNSGFGSIIPAPASMSRPSSQDLTMRPHSASSRSTLEPIYPMPRDYPPYGDESSASRDAGTVTTPPGHKPYTHKSHSSKVGLDGPQQFLDKPSTSTVLARERNILPDVPVSLGVREQDDVLSLVNHRLSQCAFDFIAYHQFPIPLEPGRPPVKIADDRAWFEWVSLLKKLAHGRLIPAESVNIAQIKLLPTLLESSLEMRHATKRSSVSPKDDRNVLQLISAGIQVAKSLKDPSAMEYLDKLYRQTESVMQERRNKPGFYR